MSSYCLLLHCRLSVYTFFFFNDTATTEIYTLSLHDALPICRGRLPCCGDFSWHGIHVLHCEILKCRSEEHTSELQSHLNLVCRLLLEKKNKHDLCKLLLELAVALSVRSLCCAGISLLRCHTT